MRAATYGAAAVLHTLHDDEEEKEEEERRGRERRRRRKATAPPAGVATLTPKGTLQAAAAKASTVG